MRIESKRRPPLTHLFVFALTFFSRALFPLLNYYLLSRLRKKGAVSASGQVLGAVALTKEEEDVIFQEGGGEERFIQLARIGIIRSTHNPPL